MQALPARGVPAVENTQSLRHADEVEPPPYMHRHLYHYRALIEEVLSSGSGMTATEEETTDSTTTTASSSDENSSTTSVNTPQTTYVDVRSTSTSSLSGIGIAGIVAGCVVLVALVMVYVQSEKKKQNTEDSVALETHRKDSQTATYMQTVLSPENGSGRSVTVDSDTSNGNNSDAVATNIQRKISNDSISGAYALTAPPTSAIPQTQSQRIKQEPGVNQYHAFDYVSQTDQQETKPFRRFDSSDQDSLRGSHHEAVDNIPDSMRGLILETPGTVYVKQNSMDRLPTIAGSLPADSMISGSPVETEEWRYTTASILAQQQANDTKVPILEWPVRTTYTRDIPVLDRNSNGSAASSEDDENAEIDI